MFARLDTEKDMVKIADEFRDWLDRRGISATKSSFATFKRVSDSSEPDNKSKKAAKSSQSIPQCVCRNWHWYRDCPYLIESKRLPGWRPDPERQANVDEPKTQKVRSAIQ